MSACLYLHIIYTETPLRTESAIFAVYEPGITRTWAWPRNALRACRRPVERNSACQEENQTGPDLCRTSLCTSVDTYIYIYITYIYIYICTYHVFVSLHTDTATDTNKCIHTYITHIQGVNKTHISMHMYIYIYTYTHNLCTYVCMHVCMYVCMYACMYVRADR